MSFIRKALGSITGATAAARGAQEASATQAASAERGIEEQRRQFDKMVELMSPYLAVGAPALTGQQALIGLQGPEAEQAAIDRLTGGSTFQELSRQGEEAILSRASATGGLRGGNVQQALAQFRPQLLSELIEQQYGRLGGLASMGQSAAAGQAAAGQQTGANVANLLANQGSALAGGQLAAGNVNRQIFGDVLGALKTGGEAFKAFGGGTAAAGGSGAAAFSDQRLKKNVKRIGTRKDGLGVYEFDYIWGGARQIGLMAQEVQAVYPDAVSEIDGFLAVDYSKV
jgi:hypothetical protein